MATLKISELSVGDWVYHDDILFGREIAKVERLNENENGETIGIKVYRSDGAFGVVGYIWTSPTQGDLHPIPITAEMLEKNWFVKNGEYDEWNIGNWKDTPFIGISLCRQSMRIKDLGTDIFLENKVVYVHQFQHALRLAGVDKEIVMLNK